MIAALVVVLIGCSDSVVDAKLNGSESLSGPVVAPRSDLDGSYLGGTPQGKAITLNGEGCEELTENLTYEFSVTGVQVGTATVEVHTVWTFDGTDFVGSSLHSFDIGPRERGAPATTEEVEIVVKGGPGGTGSTALSLDPEITNSNQSGAKLDEGDLKGLTVNFGDACTGPAPDETDPEVTISFDPPDGNSGWFVTSPVVGSVSATDNVAVVDLQCTGAVLSNLSGLNTASVSGDLTVSSDGTHTVSCTAKDAADNEGSDSKEVKRDATVPVVAVTGVANGATYVIGYVPTPGCSTTDATSGVAVNATASTTGGPVVGEFTTTCNGAEDVAGNLGSASATYFVVFDWTGFFKPIDNALKNSAKAGSAVPIKFSLAGDQGLDIFAAGYPKSAPASCDLWSLDTEVETVTAGKSSLSYDALEDQYVYVWKTEKEWSNTCRELQVKLVDGTTQKAMFSFK